MQLRTRLLLGYGYLAALLLVAVGSAALTLLDLSRGIGRILEENYQSIQACVRMIQALERQDSATLVLLVDPRAEGDSLAPHDAAFAQALADAEANVTLPDEPDLLRRVRDGYAELEEARERLLEEAPARPLAGYRTRVLPVFSKLQDDVLRLLEVNQAAMLEADRGARQSARLAGSWLGGLSALALLSLPFVARGMQRVVLDRLAELREAVHAVADGDLRRRLRDRGDDELAFVAREFNRMLDARDELRGRMAGRLAQQRQLVLALLARLGDDAFVLGLDGALLAHDGSAPAAADLAALREWAVGPGRELAGAPPSSAELALAGDRRVRLELLVAHGGRPVAWLARARG